MYIGPVAVNFLSALGGTIRRELQIHGRDQIDGDRWMQISNFFRSIEFGPSFDQNPFAASGGEQVVVAVLSGLLMNPRHLAIDTSLEQLSEKWRHGLLDFALSENFPMTSLHVADNRIAEMGEISNAYKGPLTGTQNPIRKITKRPLAQYYSGESGIVKMSDLSFGYTRSKPVLGQTSFSFQPGTIYHLRGKNGAGKSTLAKLLVGVLHPTGGNIKYKANYVQPYRNPGRIFGYSYQNPDDQFFFTNVRHELRSVRAGNQGALRQEVLQEIFGLEGLLDEHPMDLPFTIRKRVSLAAALAQDRPWYIFDEPTLGLDDENVEGLGEIFTELARLGKGILIISHSMAIFRALGDMKWEEVSLSEGRLYA